MDREIKFRLIKDGEIVGYEVHRETNDDVDRIVVEHQHLDGLSIFIHKFPDDYIKHDKKMQFTGMKDVDGQEVYEGDIIENRRDTRFLVKYATNSVRFVGTIDEGWVNLDELLEGGSLVIGNKFENPELSQE